MAKTETEEIIHLKVKSNDHEEIFFKIKKVTPLKKLMEKYCERMGLSNLNNVRFLFDGERIVPSNTPAQLNMQNGDEIDVYVEQHGGFYFQNQDLTNPKNASQIDRRKVDGRCKHFNQKDPGQIQIFSPECLCNSRNVYTDKNIFRNSYASFLSNQDDHQNFLEMVSKNPIKGQNLIHNTSNVEVKRSQVVQRDILLLEWMYQKMPSNPEFP